jgi:hypothetical protein
MTNYGFTEHEENWWAARYRQGSTLLVLGWILIGWAALLSIYFWSSLAVGSSMWLWCIGVLTVVGLVMVGAGTKMRKRPQTEFVETVHRPDKVA